MISHKYLMKLMLFLHFFSLIILCFSSFHSVLQYPFKQMLMVHRKTHLDSCFANQHIALYLHSCMKANKYLYRAISQKPTASKKKCRFTKMPCFGIILSKPALSFLFFFCRFLFYDLMTAVFV